MASTGKAGQNVVISKGGTPIANTRNTRLDQAARVLDASIHGTDKFVAKLPSLIDNKLTFDILALPKTSHAALTTDLQDQSTDSYTVVFPDTSQAAFSAFVAALNLSSPHDGLFEGSITLEIDGGITWS